MMDDRNLLFELHNDRRQQSNRHADQRERVIGIILVISSALIAFISMDGLTKSDLPISIFLTILGIYGIMFSHKHYEYNRYHSKIAQGYREKIEELYGKELQLKVIRLSAKEFRKQNFPRLSKWPLHYFWNGIPIWVSIMGILVTILILS